VPVPSNQQSRLVWFRNGVSTKRCPKNEITASSVSWLEAFYQWKVLGATAFGELDARTADAFVVLEEAYCEELQNSIVT
jgi:hypothetical protein